jgi:hypothetical protein
MLGAIVDGIAAAINGDWVEFGAQMRVATDALFQGIVTIFTNNISVIVGVVQSIINGIKNAWNNFNWRSLGTSVADGLSGGIRAGIDKVVSAAKAMAQAAKDAVTGFMGIQSPSKLFAWIAEMVVAGFVNKLNESQGLVQDAFKNLFDFTGKISGLSSAAISIFKRDLLGGLEKEIDAGGEKVKAAFVRANDLLREADLGEEAANQFATLRGELEDLESYIEGLRSGEIGISLSNAERRREIQNAEKLYRDMYDSFSEMAAASDIRLLDNLTRGEQTDLMFDALRNGNHELADAIKAVWAEQEKVNQSTREYEEQQNKILRIEKKRQQIDLMKQQLDLIKFAQENGLDPKDVFGGQQLGYEMGPEAIVDATLKAFDRVLGSLSSVLPPARPDSRSAGTVNNNNNSTNLNVTGTFQGQDPPTLASGLEQLLAGI